MSLKLMYITNNPDVASIAQKCGVDRIWIDLETYGKEERQKGIDTVKSHHTIDDIKKIKPFMNESELLVRVNQFNESSINEIDSVIDAGADIIMLPYWKTIDEVEGFIKAVNGRCKTTLLLENKEAVNIIDDVIKLFDFDEIHIGLNDLHLSYGMTFMFELLANGLVDKLCEKFKAAGIPFGFGGIARLGHGDIKAELIIKEHYRLGSTRAILSRSFCDIDKTESIGMIDKLFSEEMKRLRDFENDVSSLPKESLDQNHEMVIRTVEKIVQDRTGV